MFYHKTEKSIGMSLGVPSCPYSEKLRDFHRHADCESNCDIIQNNQKFENVFAVIYAWITVTATVTVAHFHSRTVTITRQRRYKVISTPDSNELSRSGSGRGMTPLT